ncbi:MULTISPECIES: hydrogenase formation protein HypD [Flavobacteriaceae]|uniref:Hydrogenase formation protein HypD n=2 Tax=Flavobacteriaceae TaxID=49546 RepID=A0A4Y8AR73_9FLAO|nr:MULTISPECIES: hydrogenase formation protein HypD [Flavobacteriaceae]TEW72533.1 hydrogenase formation protein HypD [Gramella jeungdoensis]GGK54949.1 hydrogenase formation protein HypD [Lutibacter litoralis]
MKYLSEYRNLAETKKVLDEIHKITTREWNIMEICGGQTHSLVKNGILELLPEKIRMIHGPGCPVCVTPLNLIDKAIELLEQGVIVCSFGDMIRVPGSKKSLLETKASGGDLRILYSPIEAVSIAKNNPDKEVVFFAVGFETTAPANALSVLHAEKEGISNYSILASHVLVPPAMEAILDDKFCTINAFLGAGHVCAIMGIKDYYPLVSKYKIPIVITGFEPLDLVQGIYIAVKQLEAGRYELANQYSRIVKEEGNKAAINVINTIFKIGNREWRGIGEISNSGYVIKEAYRKYDAEVKFNISTIKVPENPNCIAGEILRGIKKPNQCDQFGKTCKPSNPLGAPMVSSEGACAAYYHFSTNLID